jgi:histidinol-phosphate aminotransferase
LQQEGFSLSLHPRPEIENLKACYHGGINYAELEALGLSREQLIDFSVCSNPFPPPPGARKILSTIAIEQYPDPEATELKQQLSKKLGVGTDNILVGSGTTELIRLIALTYFRQGEHVLILEPTFGEYEVACQIAGAESVKQLMKPEDNFTPKIEETTSLIRQLCPKAIFICNPNNPTGNYLSRQQVETMLNVSDNTLFILDEAYVNFVNDSWSSIDLIHQGNVVILRSMTKDFALAGLRLGYALADSEIISNLRHVRPPWNVNVIAQKVGTTVLEDINYLEQSKKKIREAKQYLVTELENLGFRTLPSETNYFLMKVGNARTFRTALLKHGILVRDCTSFGLPEYVRIGTRTLPECRKLINVVHELKRQELWKPVRQ